MKPTPVKALLLDMGGVLLTNGWDSASRKRAAEHFSIDFADLNERHRIIFDAYEAGKMSLDEYLTLLIFQEKRSFSIQDFKDFMFSQSKPYPEMLQLIATLKQRYNLQTIAVNNEGRELNAHRIQTFQLKNIFDIFSSSCFVHIRKPDKDFYQMALDLGQLKPEEVIYIDDRAVFIQAAKQLGIPGIHHTSLEETCAALATFGLETAPKED